jgi:toxin ParE1/3/4
VLKLNVTPRAESDLIGIWVYTCEEWGVDQADNYLDRLEVGMKRLIDHPSIGANYDHVFSGYRRLLIEHHAVFHRLLKSEVLVVRVLHEDMDAPERLLE